MTFQEFKNQQSTLEKKVNLYSKALKKYPKGKMGLTPDHVKFSPEYQKDKLNFERAFKSLQSFNKKHLKTFKKSPIYSGK